MCVYVRIQVIWWCSVILQIASVTLSGWAASPPPASSSSGSSSGRVGSAGTELNTEPCLLPIVCVLLRFNGAGVVEDDGIDAAGAGAGETPIASKSRRVFSRSYA